MKVMALRNGLVNDGPILDSIGIKDQHLIEIVGKHSGSKQTSYAAADDYGLLSQHFAHGQT
jgi:hypothetical protein